jgi:hypothetical protein
MKSGDTAKRRCGAPKKEPDERHDRGRIPPTAPFMIGLWSVIGLRVDQDSGCLAAIARYGREFPPEHERF